MSVKDALLLALGTLGSMAGFILILTGEEKETVSAGTLLMLFNWVPFSSWGG